MKKLGVILIVFAMLALCACVKQIPPEADPNAAYEETYSGTVVEVFTEGSGADTAQVMAVETENGKTIHFTITEDTSFLWLDQISGAGGETTLEKIVQTGCVEVHCQSFQNSGYHPAITVTALPIRNDVSSPIIVRAGGQIIEPYVHFGSSMTWDAKEKAWLCADGLSLENIFPEIADQIPAFTYSEEYELEFLDNVSFGGGAAYQVYTTDFELLRLHLPIDDLTNLPEGSHYLVLRVQQVGDYIVEGDDCERFDYQCAYLVHK